jgi:SAM-dependent methyltransferase
MAQLESTTWRYYSEAIKVQHFAPDNRTRRVGALQVPARWPVGLPYASASSVDPSTIIALNVEQHYSEEDTFTLTRYRQFVRHLDRTAVDILDIGCNTGRGGAVLKSALPASRLVGVDCVPERVKRVDPAIYEKAICSFATSIDLPNSSFHAIVAGEFIEHLPPMEVSPSLSEFFRLLRLNGKLCSPLRIHVLF